VILVALVPVRTGYVRGTTSVWREHGSVLNEDEDLNTTGHETRESRAQGVYHRGCGEEERYTELITGNTSEEEDYGIRL